MTKENMLAMIFVRDKRTIINATVNGKRSCKSTIRSIAHNSKKLIDTVTILKQSVLREKKKTDRYVKKRIMK